MRIAYPNPGEGPKVSLIHPTRELTLEETAIKDVPTGLPFKYIKVSEIPTEPQARWDMEIDFSNPDGFGL